MIKKAVILILLVLSCLMVAGCTDQKNTATPTPGPTPTPVPAILPDGVPALRGIHPVVGGYTFYNGVVQRDMMVYWDGEEIGCSTPDGQWNNDPDTPITGTHTVYVEHNGQRSQEYQVTCNGEDVRLDLHIGG